MTTRSYDGSVGGGVPRRANNLRTIRMPAITTNPNAARRAPAVKSVAREKVGAGEGSGGTAVSANAVAVAATAASNSASAVPVAAAAVSIEGGNVGLPAGSDVDDGAAVSAVGGVPEAVGIVVSTVAEAVPVDADVGAGVKVREAVAEGPIVEVRDAVGLGPGVFVRVRVGVIEGVRVCDGVRV